MNNPRYVQVDRGGVLYFLRENVFNPREQHFMLLTLSDFVVEDNRLVKARTCVSDFVVEDNRLVKAGTCVSDMVNSYIQNSLETTVITEAQFESEKIKIKEHYLEF